MSRWYALALALVLAAPVPAQRASSGSSRAGSDSSRGADPAVRPMEEMHGGCGDYLSDVGAALTALRGKRNRVLAARRAGESGAALEAGRAYQVHLRRSDRVEYARDPERDWGAGGRAGMLEFIPARAGLHRVSLTRKLWVDAVQGGMAVPTQAFEMQTGCPDLFKSVVYRFAAEEPVVLQLGGKGGHEVGVVVTAAGK